MGCVGEGDYYGCDVRGVGERGRWDNDEVQGTGVVGGRWMEKFFDTRACEERADGGEYVHCGGVHLEQKAAEVDFPGWSCGREELIREAKKGRKAGGVDSAMALGERGDR